MNYGLVSHYSKSLMGEKITALAVNLCCVCFEFFACG